MKCVRIKKGNFFMVNIFIFNLLVGKFKYSFKVYWVGGGEFYFD